MRRGSGPGWGPALLASPPWQRSGAQEAKGLGGASKGRSKAEADVDRGPSRPVKARQRPGPKGWDFPSDCSSCCFKSLLIQNEVHQRAYPSSHEQPPKLEENQPHRRFFFPLFDKLYLVWFGGIDESPDKQFFPALANKEMAFSHQHDLSAVVLFLNLF